MQLIWNKNPLGTHFTKECSLTSCLDQDTYYIHHINFIFRNLFAFAFFLHIYVRLMVHYFMMQIAHCCWDIYFKKKSESMRYFSNKDYIMLFPSFMTEISLSVMSTITRFSLQQPGMAIPVLSLYYPVIWECVPQQQRKVCETFLILCLTYFTMSPRC